MRYQLVHTLGILLCGDVVHTLHRDIPHVAVSLGHHICLVPVIGRRRHYLIEMFGRTVAPDLVDTRHAHVFPHKHEVARHAHRIEHLLLVLMAS